MSPYRHIAFSQLPEILGGVVLQQVTDSHIGTLFTDTRKLVVTPHSIFLALRGKHHDSHMFLLEAYQQGVQQFIVEKGCLPAHIQEKLPQANIIAVSNSIEALQKLAAYYRQQYSMPVLAITGSNGKTIVKEWLSQMLAGHYTVVKSPQSFNSQLGVALSALQIASHHTYGIFEAGISQPGEMQKLTSILKPTVGIFTNLGPAHDEGFESPMQKAQEKALLFESCKTIFYCKDYTLVDQALTDLYGHTKQLVTWTRVPGRNAAFTVNTNFQIPTTTSLSIENDNLSYVFTLPFQQPSYIENAIHCIIFLIHEGLPAAYIQQMLQTLSALPMRLTLKQGVNGCQIIDDTYSNDLASLQAALDFMHQQQPSTPKIVILSDLLQTGLPPDLLYKEVNALLQSKQIRHFIGIGPIIQKYAEYFQISEMHFYKDAQSILQQANLIQSFQNSVILVKGARNFGLEKVVEQLQAKIHETLLEVNLDAITHNLNFFRSRLNPRTKMMVMVKASAYGSSRFEVPRLLQHHRVDYLGVAYTDEGVSLRRHGIAQPIIVMNPTPDGFDTLLTYQLEPEVYSLRILRMLADFIQQHSGVLSIHLKLDTGMHRLGFLPKDFPALLEILQNTPQLNVVSIFSHLAASDASAHDAFTHEQATLFMQQAQYIEKMLDIRPLRHLLNSAGIIRFPEYHFDMVRLGIGIHGVGFPVEIQQHLQPASTLKSVISQIKDLPAGATVSYHRKGLISRPSRVAIIAIGYADGLSRSLGNGNGAVWVNGGLAPIIGNICMDMCIVDITNIPAQEGDEVIIFGPHHSIESVTKTLNTIPYEILSQISDRIKRVYCTG